MGYASPAPRPPRRSRLIVIVVILVVVILIVGVLAFTYLESSSLPIQVTNIYIWAPDNVCGLNSNPVYTSGFNNTTGSVQTLDFYFPNFNSTACTVRTVTTNTSGFSLSNVQVPLTIAGSGATPGSMTGSMNITITAPSSPYTGNLNLILG